MRLNLTENDFFFLREAFCGLEYADDNAFAAGAWPRIPLGNSRRSFKSPS